MLGIRHEKYKNLIKGLPFSLTAGIERNRYNLSKEQNWHENPEIQLITEGSGTILLNGDIYNVSEGDIIVVNSNVLHYTFTDNRLVYTCLIISNDWCRQMNINYDTLFFLPLIKNDNLKNMIFSLEAICSNTTDALYVAKANEILLKVMIELIENYCYVKNTSPVLSKHFESVISTIDYIHINFNNKITLSQLSKALFLDKYTLCKEFKKYTGQTIFEYINHYRCIKASELLENGYTVGKAAGLCGFENLSFFTKTFKTYMGKLPSQYKKFTRR